MSGTRINRLSAVAALIAAGLFSAAGPANAATTNGGASAEQIRCGFYVGNDGTAYYGHCDAPPRTDIIINVKRFGDNFDVCVKPGTTRLGTTPPIIGAAYAHKLCRAG
jgi:hypothetical protein